MTLADKLSLVHGAPGPYVGNAVGLPALGVPPLRLQDGPQGVADGALNATCFPSVLTLTMAWDVDLARSYGAAVAAEQLAKGVNVLLGPAINLARVPWAGRNYEYMGEDPVGERFSGARVRLPPVTRL